ncbi:phage tail assembly chaperone [Oscillospiraceae bacterium LTW-04]|nr:hypothetical protein RBH76_12555 [Oscillospiraceae bacterium MB24-C1]
MLSEAFCDESSAPVEWELRQLSSMESCELQKQYEGRSQSDILLTVIACSLVYPNLRDAELLKELSQREGRTILEPAEALKALTTDAELTRLIVMYQRHNALGTSLAELAAEVKN